MGTESLVYDAVIDIDLFFVDDRHAAFSDISSLRCSV